MKLRLMICAAAASTALFAGDNDATSATYAVMNVTNAYTDTIIAVPWVGLDGNTNTISGLVNTTTLAEGDKLYMYDNGTWYEYTKSSSGVWTGAETITPEGAHTAESQVVARGSGLILKRASAGGTVLLCGRVDSNPIQTTIAANGKTLFANPTALAVDLDTKFTSAANGDTITIPLNNGGFNKYTFNGTEWGQMTKKATTITINGVERTRYNNVWSKCGSIPAGTGAWYETTGTGYTVEW
jgi:hypothetical protein